MSELRKIDKLQEAGLLGEDSKNGVQRDICDTLTEEDIDHVVRLRAKSRTPGIEKGGRFKIF